MDPQASENTQKEPEFDISIVDDTPPADQGRKPLKTDPLAVPDEVEEVSEKVKKRISELTRKTHDERREKEAALRRENEAIALAKAKMDEVAQLRKQLTFGEAAFAGESKQKHELAVATAREKFKKAYEAGDAEAIAAAQEEIAAAVTGKQQATQWEQRASQNAQKALQEKDDPVQQVPSRNNDAPAQLPSQLQDWMTANPWFGTDMEMTLAARGAHVRIVEAGIDPDKNPDAYYKEVNATMRRRFPEYEWGDNESQQETETQHKNTTTPVAPVSRAPAARGKVVLTKSQVELADRLGITKEQYARELLALQKNGA